MSNQFNVQTAGDEAIYVKFPGETTSPTPKSKHSLSIPSGYREIRRITDKNNKVIWAHKWRLTLNGDNCTFTMSSNTDPTFTRSGNVGRCKDGKNISVTVKANDGYRFRYWSDNNTNSSRTFTMTDHKSLSANIIQTFVVKFVDHNGMELEKQTVDYGSDATAPNDPIRTGYRFIGWDIAFTNVKSNLTVTAQYIQQFSVKFYAFKSASTHVKEIKVDKGKKIVDMGQSVPTESITGISGWSFGGWYDKNNGGATTSDKIEQNVKFYAYWYKTIYNSTFGTDNLEPVSPQKPKKQKDNEITEFSYIYIYTPFGTNLSLPPGSKASILHMSGLLQHDGASKSHYLIATLGYVSNILSINPNKYYERDVEEYSFVRWGEEEKEVKIIKTDQVTPSIQFNRETPAIKPTTPNSLDGWKGWSFLSNYDGARIYSFDRTAKKSPDKTLATTLTRYKYDDNYHVYFNNDIDLRKSIKLAKQIFTNKSAQNGTLYEILYNDKSHDGETIPATLPDGGSPNKLCLILSKQTHGCNVPWNLMCHVITIDLT